MELSDFYVKNQLRFARLAQVLGNCSHDYSEGEK